MNDLDEIKKRKLEELQKQYNSDIQSQTQQEAEMQSQVGALEAMAKTKMTKDAVQRYGNIKAAHPEKSMQLLMFIAQVLQSGKIDRIDDEQLKRMLAMMNSGKKEIKITRK